MSIGIFYLRLTTVKLIKLKMLTKVPVNPGRIYNLQATGWVLDGDAID